MTGLRQRESLHVYEKQDIYHTTAARSRLPAKACFEKAEPAASMALKSLVWLQWTRHGWHSGRRIWSFLQAWGGCFASGLPKITASPEA
jgi:hypothetical protein